MQYIILVIIAMTVVIFVKEKVKDKTGKEQPELVINGWKKFISEIQQVCGKTKSAHSENVSEVEKDDSLDSNEQSDK